MLPDRTTTFTLGELVAAARRALDAADLSARDGRVNVAPDARSVRYYQGLGLIDRPLRYDGRRAIYGWSHLIRLLAAKLLQAEGYALAQIQASLAAQTFESIEGAVFRAIGQPVSQPTPSIKTHVTVELAPGVLLTVDPERISDPQQLALHLKAALREVQP